MSSQQLDEERIFDVARQIPVEAARAEYLDQICAGDAGLRARVEALLEVHENEQAFLKSDPDAAPTVDHTPLTEHPGTTIGRYKLMEQIGEGGMGMVFVAEQERPIRRKVALKVIKPGMDSKAVVARFEAERQALALMDHPNIAKVLDAGTTDSGRPYFVMELVRGIPITEYCDEHKLTIRERLELFTQVCQAIQHAHQKAIIHRDIKPTNVLVTEQDGKPVPKVIDFGVAKALNQRLTERTIYTSFAQVVGTPLYMSPEQAALSAVDVDTRSDVYSLGVLLYELLTGTTPFDRKRFEQAAYDEIRRIVREEEPPKPSTKISTLGEQGSTVAQNRHTDHEKLGRAVRGDLDWIVMKALEKDRGRRYEATSALAADVGRYLSSEPVEARPPSTIYVLNRFIRRNKLPVGAVAVIALTLFIGTLAASLGLSQAWESNRSQERTLAELKVLAIDSAFEAACNGDFERVMRLVELAKKAQAEEGEIVIPMALAKLLANESVIDELENLSPPRRSAGSDAILAIAYSWAGDVKKSQETIQRMHERPREADSVYDEALRAMAPKQPWGSARQQFDDLREVVVHHPNWALARWFYAAELAGRANDTGDLELAEEGVDQARLVALTTKGGPSKARALQVYANHVAFLLAEQQSDPRTGQFRAACSQHVLQLEPAMMQFAGWFLTSVSDHSKALDAWANWYEANPKDTVRRLWYLSAVLRSENPSKAKSILKSDASGDDWANLNAALFAVFCANYDEAANIGQELADRGIELQPNARSLALALLLLGGRTTVASTVAETWTDDPRIVALAPDFAPNVWAYLGGNNASDSQLMEEAGESRVRQCIAHFYIGVRHLAEGNQADAAEQFRASLDTGQYPLTESEWARVLHHVITEAKSQRS